MLVFIEHKFPSGSVGKESTCNEGDAGDMGSISELGGSPGGGNGNPLQYSCLKDPVDRGAWQGTVGGIIYSQMWFNTYIIIDNHLGTGDCERNKTNLVFASTKLTALNDKDGK